MTFALWLLLASVNTEGCDSALSTAILEEVGASNFSDDSLEVNAQCVGSEVHVSLRDPSTQRSWQRVLMRGNDSRSDVRLAVQLVDLMHAAHAEASWESLLKEPVPVVVTKLEEPPARWNGELTAGAAWAPGIFGIEPSLAGRFGREVGPFTVGVSLLATVRASRLKSEFGIAEFGFGTASLSVGYPLHFGTLELEPSLNLGALILWSSGRATSFNYEGSVSAAGTFLASIGAAVWVPVGPIQVGVRFEAGLTPIPVRVVMPDVNGSVGRPVFSLSLGIRK